MDPAALPWPEDVSTVLAQLGRMALEGADPAALMRHATDQIVATIGADLASVEHLLADGPALLLVAGSGWREGFLGRSLTPCDPGSLGALAVASATPVLIDDLAFDRRFPIPALLAEHGVRSMIGAVIRGEEGPYGVLSAYATRPGAFTGHDRNVVGAIADVLAEAIKRRHVEDMLRRARDHERRLRERLEAHARLVVEAQEAERRRIARELHDEIGQTLTGLKLTLEQLERSPPAEVGLGLSRARSLVAELMSRVDILSLDLRPAMLDDLGLLPALLWLVGRYYAQTGVRVAVEHEGLDRTLEPDVETAAYRIVQEALTNVARHADTGRASVRCTAGEDAFLIEVRDEGAGFDSGALAGGSLKFGLVGMEERARLVGGTLAVTSEPGKGTAVVASLPIRRTAAPGPPPT
jgi:signal transduction histidine kinase